MCKKHPNIEEVCETEFDENGDLVEVYPPKYVCPRCVEDGIAEAEKLYQSLQDAMENEN